MENLSLMLFIALCIPLLMLLFLSEKKQNLLFFLIGMVVCLFCGELNAILFKAFPLPLSEFSVEISPVTEEIFKALPVLFYAFLYRPDRKTLLTVAAAVGVGFAVLESAYVFASNVGQMTVLIALIRGFGCGIGHGVSTALVGYEISFIYKKRKLFYTGTIAALSASILFHAIYNDLVSADFLLAATAIPLISLFVFLIIVRRKKV